MQVDVGPPLVGGPFPQWLRPGGKPLDTLGALSLSKRRRPYTHFMVLDIIDKARPNP